jgi:hypothetical protein
MLGISYSFCVYVRTHMNGGMHMNAFDTCSLHAYVYVCLQCVCTNTYKCMYLSAETEI